MKPMGRIEILGLPLDPVDRGEALTRIEGFLSRPGLDPVVTLNPELVVRAASDPTLRAAVHRASLVTADGVGILWAAARLAGTRLPERVTGIELTEALLARFGKNLRVFFLGARPGVAERAAAVAAERYRIEVAGYHHGYFQDPSPVLEAIDRAHPDLLLVALGERQEVFVERHRRELAARVAIGVGGTLDVLAGAARRAPDWTRRLGLEWAWRVGTDPRRWRRGLRLVRFALQVQAAARARRT